MVVKAGTVLMLLPPNTGVPPNIDDDFAAPPNIEGDEDVTIPPNIEGDEDVTVPPNIEDDEDVTVPPNTDDEDVVVSPVIDREGAPDTPNMEAGDPV